MGTQDLIAGIVTALCAVLFLKRLFFPKRGKSTTTSCSCGKDTALPGKSTGDMGKKRPDFSENATCPGCPFCCENKEAEPRPDKDKG